MKCPHCLESFHDSPNEHYVIADKDMQWGIRSRICPACQRAVIELVTGIWVAPARSFRPLTSAQLIYPHGVSRTPVPPEVPAAIAEDYHEACLVLSDSPKASAALSRRCLQALLRDAAKVKPADLADEIQQVLDSGKLPSQLAESIDAIRNVGNFSAHPLKSKSSGDIIPVEPNEAEWNLDVLEALFDFYYVQPARIAAKRAALNAKLSDSGKPPMK